MMVKEPGPGGMRRQHAPLDISFAKAFGMLFKDAYERLLMDALRGNAALFMRRDQVEAAWVRSGERRGPMPPTPLGPNASVALNERDGRTRNEEHQ